MFLGTGLYLANSLRPPAGSNAAPSIASVILNFDLVTNTAPVGQSQAMEFIVPAGNAPPVGQSKTMRFAVPPGNTAPVGQSQTMEFDVFAPNAPPSVGVVLLNFDLV